MINTLCCRHSRSINKLSSQVINNQHITIPRKFILMMMSTFKIIGQHRRSFDLYIINDTTLYIFRMIMSLQTYFTPSCLSGIAKHTSTILSYTSSQARHKGTQSRFDTWSMKDFWSIPSLIKSGMTLGRWLSSSNVRLH